MSPPRWSDPTRVLSRVPWREWPTSRIEGHIVRPSMTWSASRERWRRRRRPGGRRAVPRCPNPVDRHITPGQEAERSGLQYARRPSIEALRARRSEGRVRAPSASRIGGASRTILRGPLTRNPDHRGDGFRGGPVGDSTNSLLERAGVVAVGRLRGARCAPSPTVRTSRPISRKNRSRLSLIERLMRRPGHFGDAAPRSVGGALDVEQGEEPGQVQDPDNDR
jgi:hypothetical protein